MVKEKEKNNHKEHKEKTKITKLTLSKFLCDLSANLCELCG